jgi:glycosyltransferase involved in cell wall biosynthesis
VRAEIERLGLAGRVELLGRVTDAELVTLYRGASAYLDPTLFEGFGYQVLEAMACGAPVVASGTTSIPEIVGDAGLLCDPADPGAFADALVRVLEEPGLAAELRRRGLERAAGFTWERAARQIAGALEEALAA